MASLRLNACFTKLTKRYHLQTLLKLNYSWCVPFYLGTRGNQLYYKIKVLLEVHVFNEWEHNTLIFIKQDFFNFWEPNWRYDFWRSN